MLGSSVAPQSSFCKGSPLQAPERGLRAHGDRRCHDNGVNDPRATFDSWIFHNLSFNFQCLCTRNDSINNDFELIFVILALK